jgi:hypothetical protein
VLDISDDRITIDSDRNWEKKEIDELTKNLWSQI